MSKLVSLQHFCRHTVAFCSTSVFFGDKLLEIAPEFGKHYQAFELDSWKMFYRLPVVSAKSVRKAKEQAVDGLVHYLRLPAEERADMAWMFHTITSELGYLGVGERDIAEFVMCYVWA